MRRPRKKGTTETTSEGNSDSSVATMPELQETGRAQEPHEAAPQSFGDTSAAAPDRDRIAMRAYELYLARGASEGRELDDWLAAERELSAPDTDRNSE